MRSQSIRALAVLPVLGLVIFGGFAAAAIFLANQPSPH